MFIGSERELADLNRRYDSGKFELAVIYGRRRVGKTTLINKFVKDKECIFLFSHRNQCQAESDRTQQKHLCTFR